MTARLWFAVAAAALVVATILSPVAALASTAAPATIRPAFVAGAGAVDAAPANSEFTDYQLRLQTSNLLKSLVAGPVPTVAGGLGRVPSPVAAPTGQATAVPAGLKTAGLPSSYDLRTTGKLTPVRNQGGYGTCWAFASVGSLESNLMTSDPVDLSEDHVALDSGFFGATATASAHYNNGGNCQMAGAYFARWDGPVYETDEPYATGHVIAGLSAKRHVQDVTYLPKRTGPGDNDPIKTAVMDQGAVDVSMYWADSAYNATTHAFNYTGATTWNHDVCVVGWDDSYAASNFTSVPAGNGAWIVRNSWGSSWGASGYFYVSYYDSSFANDVNAVFSAQSASNYASVLQYDPLGEVGTVGDGSTNTFWGMNKFAVASASDLKAVSFYAEGPSTAYVVYASTGGALTQLASGTMTYAGYHTVALPSAMQVPAGSTLSVAVKLTTPGVTHPLAIQRRWTNYSDQATGTAGHGFYSSNGSTWYDITSWVSNSAVCLKAFTSPTVVQPSTDTTPPLTTLTFISPAGYASAWTSASVGFSLSAADGIGGSGVTGTYYGLSGLATTPYATPVTVSGEGATTVSYRSVDASGNWETARSATVRIDKTRPSLAATTATAPNTAGWWRAPTTVHFTASDALSGVAAVAPDVQVAAMTAGQSVVGTARDMAGNVATSTIVVKADWAAPATTDDHVPTYTASATVHLTPTDPLSGVASTNWTLDGVPGTGATVTTSAVGPHTLIYRSTDIAGNTETSHTVGFTIGTADKPLYTIAGLDRYATAVAASRSAFATGACPAVVIATGHNYPDALGASGLAGACGGPVLLVNGGLTSLDATTKAEIDRVTSGQALRTVYIAGGAGAVSDGIKQGLVAAYPGARVARLAGANRYGTAQAVAVEMAAVLKTAGTPWPHKVIVATGADYHDALLAGPVSFRAHIPILLVAPSLDAGFKTTCAKIGATDAMIVGSTASVKPAVQTAIGTALGGAAHVTRPVAAADPYSQSVAVADWAVANYGLTWDGVGLATGQNYPDALGAGPAMGAMGAPLLFTHTAYLDPGAGVALTAHAADITCARFFGGDGALAPAVHSAVAAAIR